MVWFCVWVGGGGSATNKQTYTHTPYTLHTHTPYTTLNVPCENIAALFLVVKQPKHATISKERMLNACISRVFVCVCVELMYINSLNVIH